MDIIYDASTKIKSCKDEQSFKMAYIDELRIVNNGTFFCIETEETVLGFPDVLFIEKGTQKAKLLEFKYARSGKIKFKPAQPAFYRTNAKLDISIVAYNPDSKRVHIFSAEKLFDPNSTYHIDGCFSRLV